jgi:hypothetical protein
MMRDGCSFGSECGAILVHMAVALLVATALSALAIDSGVMWLARTQAQNAADAAALSGAAAMACDIGDWSDSSLIKRSAITLAREHGVWTEPSRLLPEDVLFPVCPDGSPDSCVRVNIYRDEEHGNALPAVFLPLVGVSSQNVRATATAQVVPVSVTDCLRPWAIPDKWIENYPEPAPWTEDKTFDKYDGRGNPLPTADVYRPPSLNDPGTGFRTETDCGAEITLKHGDPGDSMASGWFHAVDLPRADGGGGGGSQYRRNIESCNGQPIAIGDSLPLQSGNVVGPTAQGVRDLIAQDPTAYWDRVARAVRGGCMEAGTCLKSPRLVAIAAFDIDAFVSSGRRGGGDVIVRNILGFFIDRLEDGDVVGFLTLYPGLAIGEPMVGHRSAFMKMVALVR